MKKNAVFALNIFLAVPSLILLSAVFVSVTKVDAGVVLTFIALVLSLLLPILIEAKIPVGDFFKTKSCSMVLAVQIVLCLGIFLFSRRSEPAPAHKAPMQPQNQVPEVLHRESANPTFPLTILTTPGNANIHVAEKFCGVTPKTVYLPGGTYEVRIELEGFRNYKDIISIPRQNVLSIQLEAK